MTRKKRVQKSTVFCSWCNCGDKQTVAMLSLNKHNLYMCWPCLECAYQAMLVFIWDGKRK